MLTKKCIACQYGNADPICLLQFLQKAPVLLSGVIGGTELNYPGALS